MDQKTLYVRATTSADLAAVDRLLARSYPVLLKADYPLSILVTAVPLISKAQPALLTSGRYYVVEDEGEIVAAGGVTASPPRGWRGEATTGHIRHVATDPARTRQGIGRRLMEHLFEVARGDGLTRLDALSTRTAVPFYAAQGFTEVTAVNVELRPGIDFPSVLMQREL